MDAAIALDHLPVLSTGSPGAMSAAPLPTAEVPEHPADEGIKEQQVASGQNVKGDKGAKPKKKRVITEARKEQNRIAQRAFRQRQKELGQRTKAETKNQPGVKKHRELLPRGADTGKSITNHESRLQVPSTPSDGMPHEPLTSAGSQNILALLPSPPDSTSPLPQSSETDRRLEEVWQQLAMPDPRANTQEFLETTVCSAILHNGLSLGFDLETIADCSIECMSPFYRPTTPQDDPVALLASAISHLAVEPPVYLRPTLAQVLIPHHASLDLIPLPNLRDRAIMLSAAMPTVFNIWELKVDIYERGGLGVSKGNGRGWRGNQPWQRESWVAAPWFLRKWSMFLEDDKEQLSAHSIGRVGEITGDHVGEFVI
ncbi:unnamed protein product [Clonostachys chloroleuca]|uniref:BZIP domain-containing protein n=1 Tax=Clonostachys chloroleuca TaxID=1926264 RepID=A0AA35MDQ0_9HYPO|nr:unnamed protein product [Clonostachys chloroleuca]